MIRRSFLRQLATLPFIAAASPGAPVANAGKLKILMKSAWGSDDPTKAAFPFFTVTRSLKPNAISNAKFRSRSDRAVIRVYDEAGNVIETHESPGDFKEW
jgi:hypothetical protein